MSNSWTLQGAEKLYAQTSWGDIRDQNKDLLSSKHSRKCVLAVPLTTELCVTRVENQGQTLKHSVKFVFCQFRVDVQQYGHRSQCKSKMPSSYLMVAAASTLRTIRPASEWTGDEQIKVFMELHREKSTRVRSSDRGGQATGQHRPIQRLLLIAMRCSLTWRGKWGEASWRRTACLSWVPKGDFLQQFW